MLSNAGCSLWRGRIGRLSSIRMAGAKRCGKVIVTVPGSVETTVSGLPPTLSPEAQDALREILGGLKGEHHVRGRERRAVREGTLGRSLTV